MTESNKKIDCFDRNALNSLYYRLRPFAVSKTQYLIGDVNSAQDIVQDVFEQLIRKPVVFNDERMAYQWVYKCCHNRAIDYLRQSRRRREILDGASHELYPEPKTPTDRLANRQVLLKLMTRFDKRQSEIFAYVFVDGLTHAEISDLAGISTKTVQRTLSQIEDILRRMRGVMV